MKRRMMSAAFALSLAAGGCGNTADTKAATPEAAKTAAAVAEATPTATGENAEATTPEAAAEAKPKAPAADKAAAAVTKTTPTPKAAAPNTETPVNNAPETPADVAATPADAEKTASGLASKVLTAVTGDVHPKAEDTVQVHYSGWTTDGKMFDSSVKRGQPTSFPLNRVIKGWTEGLQLMVVGEKRRFWIPADLAYGETPSRPGAPSGLLVFDVELLDIKVAPTVDVPADVAAAPADAKKTESGLAYKVLKEGTGDKHPAATDTVKVHYSGWTTDGKMFDSSVMRGAPASFALNRVIKGWTEGLQLMKVGESTRFWIPGALAYGETPSRPGAPSGLLVFDVELLAIQ